mgnify:CR=1 FL=1
MNPGVTTRDAKLQACDSSGILFAELNNRAAIKAAPERAGNAIEGLTTAPLLLLDSGENHG